MSLQRSRVALRRVLFPAPSLPCAAILIAVAVSMSGRLGLVADEATESPRPVPPPAGARAQKIDLRPLFVEGRERRYTLEQTTTAAVGTVEQGSALRTTCRFVPKKVGADGGATVELDYEAAAMTLTLGKKRRTFDTQDPNAPEGDKTLGRLLRAFAGKSLELEFAPSGEVRKIRGLDEIVAGPDGSLLRPFLDEDALRRVLGKLSTPTVGKESSTIGERWTDREVSEFDEETSLVVELEYRLAGVDEGRARIELGGKARFEARDGAAGPVKYAFEKQSIRGEILWDVRERLLLRHELDTRIVIRGPLADGTDGAMRVDQSSRTTVDE